MSHSCDARWSGDRGGPRSRPKSHRSIRHRPINTRTGAKANRQRPLRIPDGKNQRYHFELEQRGEVTFLNRYGQHFFGYSSDEILGKPMLGTLTPLAGFQGRDLTTFMAGVVHHPNRYAFSVNTNMLHDGKRVQTFWANKGISDDQGNVREVLRVGLDITDRKLRLEALAQELRGIGQLLDGRDWVQRSKLKEITSRIEAISEELERPWKESDTGDYESVSPK